MASRWMVRAQAARGASVCNARWRGMSSASQGDEAPSSSWFQRIKNMFVKSDLKSPSEEVKQSQVPKPSSPPQEVAATPAAEQPSSSSLQSMASKVVHTVKAAISGPYSMESFADEMKNARRAESLAKYMKGMPKNREHVVVSVLERQERMLRTLATYKTEQFDVQQKEEVASKCGGSVLEVEEILAKYAWAKEAHNRVEKRRKEGKPLPKNLQEVEAMMGGSYKSPVSKDTKVGRNDTCPCGSGKKYKRCCATAYS